MRYCFDLDGTLCSTVASGDYRLARPYTESIAEVNRLFDCGNEIEIRTARGNHSGKDWKTVTEQQLQSWGCRYHRLEVGTKRGADLFIDDQGLNALDWRRSLERRTIGFLAGSFDLLHPGYIAAFKEAKQHCNYLVVALHTDPRIERPQKNAPLISVEDREVALRECRSVDEVVRYTTEAELVALLKVIQPHVRFLGDDYRDAPSYTGSDLGICAIFLSREHGWSMTKVRGLLGNAS